MKTIQVLRNNNKLYSETAVDAYYPNQSTEFSIRLVFSGSETYNLGNRELNVYPGSFLVLNEGTEFSRKIDSINPVTTFSVIFSNSFLQDFHKTMVFSNKSLLENPFEAENYTLPRFTESLYPLSGDLKFNLQHLKQHFDNRLDNELLINEYMHHCLLLYYRIYHADMLNKSNKLLFLNQQTKAEIMRRLTIAKDFMLSNFEKGISLEDISREACLSVNHLLRTFRQAYNCSPHQYLMKTRLSHAKFLLQNTNFQVTDIAAMVGFQCPSSFIRLFRSTFKVTPGNYRLTGTAIMN